MTAVQSRPDRRRSPRIALRVAAVVQDPNHTRVEIRVIDVSLFGCRIEGNWSPCLAEYVSLDLDTIGTQRMRVVWQTESFAGLEFTNPLSEAAMETLLAADGNAPELKIPELYDIARRSRESAAKLLTSPATHELTDLSKSCIAAVLHQILNNTPGGDFSPAPIHKPYVARV